MPCGICGAPGHNHRTCSKTHNKTQPNQNSIPHQQSQIRPTQTKKALEISSQQKRALENFESDLVGPDPDLTNLSLVDLYLHYWSDILPILMMDLRNMVKFPLCVVVSVGNL